MADLADVTYWVAYWQQTGEPIPANVATRIADYWQLPHPVSTDDIATAINYARTAGIWRATIGELYALQSYLNGPQTGIR